MRRLAKFDVSTFCAWVFAPPTCIPRCSDMCTPTIAPPLVFLFDVMLASVCYLAGMLWSYSSDSAYLLYVLTTAWVSTIALCVVAEWSRDGWWLQAAAWCTGVAICMTVAYAKRRMPAYMGKHIADTYMSVSMTHTTDEKQRFTIGDEEALSSDTFDQHTGVCHNTYKTSDPCNVTSTGSAPCTSS